MRAIKKFFTAIGVTILSLAMALIVALTAVTILTIQLIAR